MKKRQIVNKRKLVKKQFKPNRPILPVTQHNCIQTFKGRLTSTLNINVFYLWCQMLVFDINKKQGRIPATGDFFTPVNVMFYLRRILMYLAWRRGQLDTTESVPPNSSSVFVPHMIAKYFQYLSDYSKDGVEFRMLWSNLDAPGVLTFSEAGPSNVCLVQINVDAATGEPIFGTGIPNQTDADLSDKAISEISAIIGNVYPDAIPVSKIPDFAPDASCIMRIMASDIGQFPLVAVPFCVNLNFFDIDDADFSISQVTHACYYQSDVDTSTVLVAQAANAIMWDLWKEARYSPTSTIPGVLKSRGFNNGLLTAAGISFNSNVLWQQAIQQVFSDPAIAGDTDTRNYVYNFFLYLLGLWLTNASMASTCDLARKYPSYGVYSTPSYLGGPSNPAIGYLTSPGLHISNGVIIIPTLSHDTTAGISTTSHPLTMFNFTLNITAASGSPDYNTPPFTSTGSYPWRVGINASDMTITTYNMVSLAQINTILGRWVSQNANVTTADFSKLPCTCLADYRIGANRTDTNGNFAIYGSEVTSISANSIVCGEICFMRNLPKFNRTGYAKYYQDLKAGDKDTARVAMAAIKLDNVSREVIQKSSNVVASWNKLMASKVSKHNTTVYSVKKTDLLKTAGTFLKEAGPYLEDIAAVGGTVISMAGAPELGAVITAAALALKNGGAAKIANFIDVVVKH